MEAVYFLRDGFRCLVVSAGKLLAFVPPSLLATYRESIKGRRAVQRESLRCHQPSPLPVRSLNFPVYFFYVEMDCSEVMEDAGEKGEILWLNEATQKRLN